MVKSNKKNLVFLLKFIVLLNFFNSYIFAQTKQNSIIKLFCLNSFKEEMFKAEIEDEYGDKYHIGYSDHSMGTHIPVAAVSLGAQIIERHITLSHNLWGTDQKSSLEVVGMDKLRKRCIDVGDMLGSNVKEVTESELPIRKKLRG